MAGRRHARVSRAAGALGLIMLLAACASRGPPADEDIARAIREYYATHGLEEGGRCFTPQIAAIVGRDVLSGGAEEMRLRVRYAYFDPAQAEPTDWQRVLDADQPCTGVAEREFTLERTPLGYVVVGMSGDQRSG